MTFRSILRFLFCYREVDMSIAQQLQQLQEFRKELAAAAKEWKDFQAQLEGADIQEQTALLKKNTDPLAESVQANQ